MDINETSFPIRRTHLEATRLPNIDYTQLPRYEKTHVKIQLNRLCQCNLTSLGEIQNHDCTIIIDSQPCSKQKNSPKQSKLL